MTSSIAALPAPRSRAMLGKASCTISASSTVMKLPASNTARPRRRRGIAVSATAIGASIAQISLDAMLDPGRGFRLDGWDDATQYGTRLILVLDWNLFC